MDDNFKVQKITVCTVQFQHLMTEFHVNRVSHKIMLVFLASYYYIVYIKYYGRYLWRL